METKAELESPEDVFDEYNRTVSELREFRSKFFRYEDENEKNRIDIKQIINTWGIVAGYILLKYFLVSDMRVSSFRAQLDRIKESMKFIEGNEIESPKYMLDVLNKKVSELWELRLQFFRYNDEDEDENEENRRIILRKMVLSSSVAEYIITNHLAKSDMCELSSLIEQIDRINEIMEFIKENQNRVIKKIGGHSIYRWLNQNKSIVQDYLISEGCPPSLIDLEMEVEAVRTVPHIKDLAIKDNMAFYREEEEPEFW